MNNKESKGCPLWVIKIRNHFNWKIIVGMVIGIVGGYFYYREIGCKSGSCPLTSSPWLSMLWGGAMGYLIGGMLPQRKNQTPDNQDNNTD